MGVKQINHEVVVIAGRQLLVHPPMRHGRQTIKTIALHFRDLDAHQTPAMLLKNIMIPVESLFVRFEMQVRVWTTDVACAAE